MNENDLRMALESILGPVDEQEIPLEPSTISGEPGKPYILGNFLQVAMTDEENAAYEQAMGGSEFLPTLIGLDDQMRELMDTREPTIENQLLLLDMQVRQTLVKQEFIKEIAAYVQAQKAAHDSQSG